jgi:hypothetical protein
MIGTKIEYLYRDAANYKFRGVILVSGRITFNKIEPLLFDQEYFIPSVVGINSLAPLHLTQDDHNLHEFAGFFEVEISECQVSAASLLRRFERAAKEGWFEWRERNGQSRSYSSY